MSDTCSRHDATLCCTSIIRYICMTINSFEFKSQMYFSRPLVIYNIYSSLRVSGYQKVEEDDTQVFTRATIACENEYQEIDITSMLGVFTPSYFLYFPHVTQLDVSGCHSFDNSLFVDCVTAMKNLTEIVMIGCTKFNEHQLVRILTNLPKLQIVDCTHATPFLFCNAYTVVCALSNLRTINLEPKYEHLELVDWKRLFCIFLDVQFGHSIRRILPYHGKYLRNSNNDEE